MTHALLAFLRGALADRRGVTASECAVLGLGVVVIIASAVLTFGTSLSSAFDRVGSAFVLGG
ncbi:hypothetical protein KPL78_03040 [Roseomonas sp. HJA6]|uniref:Flp family type IVb pilin n=1 Tax=Roseomonas alba TaxID=2846776 RepID=A0ABS7A3R2_9PROT|nr:hypothetical protein [Neoroseomonas alba]MBW6396803.1 hypothetical protein [Neoroseomonas alba]